MWDIFARFGKNMADCMELILSLTLISGKETVIYAVLHLFGMCNALTNPILYGYLNENFRKEYRNIYR